MTTGLLLVNLGTPQSYQAKDVRKYLLEFLTDPRVIDTSPLVRQFLVRGVIVPRRYKESAASYKKIWLKEGSPLLIYGQRVRDKLQHQLGSEYQVELAMRYQQPSIKEGLEKLLKNKVEELIVLPLFPQYASATTGSIYEKVMKELSSYQIIPKLRFIDQFAEDPLFLDAFAKRGRQYDLESYDEILISFHGLPQKQIKKADRNGWCLSDRSCCQLPCQENRECYSAQCYRTAEGIASRLDLKRYTVCFQSRLGKDPWLQPYASDVIQQLAREGKKRILVFCPSFVCDCLETLFEFSVEYQKEFQEAGGEVLDLVEGLNDDDSWIEALQSICNIKKRMLLH